MTDDGCSTPVPGTLHMHGGRATGPSPNLPNFPYTDAVRMDPGNDTLSDSPCSQALQTLLLIAPLLPFGILDLLLTSLFFGE